MCWIDREPPKMNKVFRIRPENINIRKYDAVKYLQENYVPPMFFGVI